MHFQQKVRRRNKIGVEDGDEFAFGRFQACFQSSRFEAFTILAMDVGDRMSQRNIAIDQNARDLDGLVGRVIEQLDIELIFRIFKPAHGVEQPIHHILLIKDRQLHGDTRQVVEVGWRFGRLIFFVLVI